VPYRVINVCAADSSIKSSGIDGSIPEAAASASSFGGRQGSEEQILREEDTDDDDNIDFDDPKYQQKPDWMQDAVWESINNQSKETLCVTIKHCNQYVGVCFRWEITQ